MLKYVRNILMLAGALILGISCEDSLDQPPVGSISPDGYYSTPEHINQGVRGVYSKLSNIETVQYLLLSEDRSDNVFVEPMPNAVRSCSEISNWRFSATTGELESLWSGWYSLIYNANMVLAAIDGVEFSDASLKNHYKGELLFLRGYAHFELARTFGRVPIVDRNMSVAEAKALKQSEPAAVMAAAEADLLEAEGLLSDEAPESGRAGKVADQAMLARLYMTLKGFPFNDSSATAKAKSYLEKVLSYSRNNGDRYWAPDLDAWKKQWVSVVNPEWANEYQIFSIQHRLNTPSLMAMNEGIGVSSEFLTNITNYTNGTEMSPVYPEGSLWYEYTVNNDPRGAGQAFMDTYGAYGGTPAYGNVTYDMEIDGEVHTIYMSSINTKWLPYDQKREAYGVTFSDNSLSGGWPLNFPVLRLEDMMLLYAELLVEEGNTTQAMTYVNRIRSRAGVANVPESPSASEAMEYVKRERKLELYLEGVRWFDQVRYGDWIETTLAKFDRYSNYGNISNVARGNVSGQRFYCPIPDAELKSVTGLYTQNPDW